MPFSESCLSATVFKVKFIMADTRTRARWQRHQPAVARREKGGRGSHGGRGKSPWCPHRRPILSGVSGFVYFPNLSQRTLGGAPPGGGEGRGGGRKRAGQGGDASTSCFTRSRSTVETWPQDLSWGESTEFCRIFFLPLRVLSTLLYRSGSR